MPKQRGELVVIGFAEALSGPEVTWSLVDAGYRVVCFARRGGRNPLQCSRYVEVYEVTPPEHSLDDCLHEITALLGALEPSTDRLVILPIDDSALWLCKQLDVGESRVFAGARDASARLALDKREQIELAAATGFDVPETRFITDRDALSSAVTKFPVIVRPADAVTVRDDKFVKGRNWICSNEAELLNIHSQWAGNETLMIQPFLSGIGEGVFGLALDSEIVAWSGHQRLRMMNPHGSGSSACMSQPAPDQLKGPIKAFLHSCHWQGMFMFELLRTADNKLWFVEFNGRAWGSMALARKLKLEYPAWTVRAALEPHWRPDSQRMLQEEAIECRNLGREVMHLLFLLRGPQSRAIERWPSFWRTVLDMLRPRRPVYLYNWRAGDWRVIFCDFRRTIAGQIFKRSV